MGYSAWGHKESDTTEWGSTAHMQERRVWSLVQEDPPEEEMATHSSILMENPTDSGAWWGI